ncbi:MAG: response regulator [Bacteroidetes bacterium]|nr:response regulator [Bacteroidota bacterium]
MEKSRELYCILVDDDSDELEIFNVAIEAINYKVQFDGFTDFDLALKSIYAKQPDYIFLDNKMGAMSGIDCLKKLKSIEELAHIPVVIYSGSINGLEKKEAEQLGALSIIAKSDSIKEMAFSLESFFNDFFKEKSFVSR